MNNLKDRSLNELKLILKEAKTELFMLGDKNIEHLKDLSETYNFNYVAKNELDIKDKKQEIKNIKNEIAKKEMEVK